MKRGDRAKAQYGKIEFGEMSIVEVGSDHVLLATPGAIAVADATGNPPATVRVDKAKCQVKAGRAPAPRSPKAIAKARPKKKQKSSSKPKGPS